jgi:cysteinyl-tRNA synthetase
VTLRLRNTLGGALEAFEPLDPDNVRIYSCGPTVYAPAHIGNFRSFLFADILRRYLAWRGYPVTWVMNITDVDDKIIRDATAQGIPIGELTSRYEAAFIDDLRRLRITMPDVLPRATEHIDAMVTLIETLLERGHAYRTEDGSIFFRIASWPAYGRLARLDPASQRVGGRVESDEYDKDDVRDFAVWKGAKPGEPSWSTRLGEGRPG